MIVTPIELVEFIYRTQKQQFKYTWYFYYKIICENRNTLSKTGALIASIINLQVAYKTLQILKEMKKNEK